MKKRYLCIVALLATSFSFGQVNQQAPAQNVATQTASPANTTEQSTRPLNTTQQTTISPVQNGPSQGHSCATHELNEAYYQSIGMLQEFNQSYMQSAQNAANMTFPETPNPNEISVIFHVVYNPNNPPENVSNAAIMSVFQELQEDFQLLNADAANARTALGFIPADCDINFCLATQDPQGNPLPEVGVVRVSTNEDYYDHDGGEENKMKSSLTGGSDIWDRNKYLNVWICNITDTLNYGTAGYAYRPTPTMLPGAAIDGVVIDYNIGLGSNVLTHEVGHYLGLDHTWGGSGGCSNDDGFTDTPNTNGPADQDPTFSCGLASYMSCGVEVQYENYMDYATGCTVMYTQEQANYMLSILQGIRGSLLLSPGCDPTNTPPNSAFTSIPLPPSPVIIPANGSINFIDQSTNVPTGWNWTISGTQGVDWNWINGTNATSQDPEAEFYTAGLYDVTLAASNSYGTDPTPAVEIGYVQVAAPAVGIGCDTLRNWNPAAGISVVSWQPPSVGYAHGNSVIGTETSLQWAETYTTAVTTNINAIEYAPARVNDGGGEIIWKVWTNNAGQPGTVLAEDTVLLADITEGAWNYIQVSPPVTNITGTFWVGYELSYANVADTFALYSQIVSAAANTTSWENSTGWETIATTTGNAAGINGLIDVLTSASTTPPVMDFTATTDVLCVGGDITVNGSSSTGNNDYRWYVTDDPWTTNLETSNTAGNTFNFPYAPGTYNIYLFGDGSCMSSGVYMPVTLNAQVTATVTPAATTCGNNNGTITVSNEAGGDGTYYYSLDGVNYQVSNTFNNLAPGDYDVYVATFGDNCEAMYTVNVGTSTPATASASANQGICPGGSASITATGGGTYAWYDGANLLGTTATISVSPTTTTQYSCIVTDGGGCQATVYTTVEVNTPVQPTISASGTTTICDGTTIDLTSSSPTGNVWSTGETSSTITVSTAGPFTVTAPDANGCSATSDPISITILAAPAIASGTVNGPSACATSTGSIEITGSGTGTVDWTGTASGTSGAVSLPFTIPNLAAGGYNVTFTDGNGCVSNLVTETLNDPNPPATPTVTANGPVTFCDGGSVTLSSSYGTNNVWSTAETTQDIVVTTTQTITVTYTDGSGCSSTSAPTTVTVNPNPAPPTITASGSTTFCDGGSITLSSSQGTGNVWSTTETTQDITVSTSGNYDVTYTNANGCSATSATTTVTVNPLPSVSFGTLSDVCNYWDPVTLSAGSPAGGTYSGTGVTGGQFDPGTAGLGTHTLTYTYTDGNGCVNTATSDILVDECLSIDDLESIGLNIFPNPATDELNITLTGDFGYEIIDARGRVVASGNGSNQVTLNTTNFETGVYLITINNAETTVTARVVKQ